VGGEQRRGDDEAVDQQQHAAFGGAEHGAGHHGDLEAAVFGQHGQRVGRPAAARRRLGEQARLRFRPASSRPVPRPITLSSSAPVRQWVMSEAAAVLPMPISPKPTTLQPCVGQPAGQLAAAGQRGVRVPASIAGFFDVVGGAGAEFGVDQAPGAEIMGHAGIDNRQRHAHLAGETLIAAPPARKFSTICQVTSCG
jgi:hypothetical protein